ncbi:mCG1027279 [Mus musculus]|jgi:hypothetical protein|nr:mCG1027279 [Mus musculus]
MKPCQKIEGNLEKEDEPKPEEKPEEGQEPEEEEKSEERLIRSPGFSGGYTQQASEQ